MDEDRPSTESQLELILDVLDAAGGLEGRTESVLAACGAPDAPTGITARRAGELIVQYHRLQQRLQDLPLDGQRSVLASEVDERLLLRAARLRTALQLAFTSNPSAITESARLAWRGLGGETARLLDLRAAVAAQLVQARDGAGAPIFPGLTALLNNSPLSPRRRRSVIALTAAAVILPAAFAVMSATGSPAHPAAITWINDTGMDLYVHPCAYQACDETDQRTAWVKAPEGARPLSHTWDGVEQPARFAVSASAQGQGPLRCIPAQATSPAVRLSSAHPCS